MAVRDDFAAGEVLAAADLNDTFASKLPYSYGTATPTTSVDGFLWYDENDTPPTPKFWDGAAFQALTSGKILQVVRATDGTDRTTTSTTFVDVTGMSVTITPQKNTSAILLIFTGLAESTGATAQFRITDSSDNAVSGAQQLNYRVSNYSSSQLLPMVGIGYSTPATTSATTYKVRFRNNTGNSTSLNGSNMTSQIYAIEVSA